LIRFKKLIECFGIHDYKYRKKYPRKKIILIYSLMDKIIKLKIKLWKKKYWKII
jgi:hypothetical protein